MRKLLPFPQSLGKKQIQKIVANNLQNLYYQTWFVVEQLSRVPLFL